MSTCSTLNLAPTDEASNAQINSSSESNDDEESSRDDDTDQDFDISFQSTDMEPTHVEKLSNIYINKSFHTSG